MMNSYKGTGVQETGYVVTGPLRRECDELFVPHSSRPWPQFDVRYLLSVHISIIWYKLSCCFKLIAPCYYYYFSFCNKTQNYASKHAHWQAHFPKKAQTRHTKFIRQEQPSFHPSLVLYSFFYSFSCMMSWHTFEGSNLWQFYVLLCDVMEEVERLFSIMWSKWRRDSISSSRMLGKSRLWRN